MSNVIQLPLECQGSKRVGVAGLTKAAFAGQDLISLATKLFISLSAAPNDAGALMDLSFIEQLKGNHEMGKVYQDAALQISQVYQSQEARGDALKLLVLAAPIHMGGNLPIEFLLEDSGIGITYLYVLPGIPLPNPLPEHDLIYVVAPGDTDFMREFLQDIESRLDSFSTPVLCHPEFIAGLERDDLCRTLAGIPNLISPKTVRCQREELRAVGRGQICLSELFPGEKLPIVIRPVGSHAGRNLELLTRLDDIENYLERCPDDEIFMSQYIDYRSHDGLFRKYRVAFIDGQPFASHMAIADRWDIWYMNAGMLESETKRAEEEQFMLDFDEGFATRNKNALAVIANNVQLEYFGIDCAETTDGELVIFEGDNALLIHDMDPSQIFPYKSAQMQKIFTAFESMLIRSSGKAISQPQIKALANN